MHIVWKNVLEILLTKGSPFLIWALFFWGLPVWGGGGLNTCPDGLGHFFREEFSKFKRAFAWFWGGLNPCPDGLGHLFRENGKQNGKNGKMVKSRLKKSAPECPFECGGGGVNAIWAMPKWRWWQAERGFPYISCKERAWLWGEFSCVFQVRISEICYCIYCMKVFLNIWCFCFFLHSVGLFCQCGWSYDSLDGLFW